MQSAEIAASGTKNLTNEYQKSDGASEYIQNRRSRSPLRDIEPGRPAEGINVTPRHSPADVGGHVQYRNSSRRDIGRDDTSFRGRDTYWPAQDRLDRTTSRTGYGNHRDADWSERAPDANYTYHTDASSAQQSLSPDLNKSVVHREHPNVQLQHATATESKSATQMPRATSRDRTGQTTSQKAPNSGLPHLVNAKDVQTPPTVYDLRVYNTRINNHYATLPKHEQFRNGTNGKIAPSIYGSETRHDLGLCFATFLTRNICEMGLDCPWRHHPLSVVEQIWIVEYGGERGKQFLGNVERCYSFPQMPVPGANMHRMAEQ